MLAFFSILPGIACIALSFVDPQGCPLQGPAQDSTDVQRSEICTSLLHPHQFDELTSVMKVDSIGGGGSAAGRHNCSASAPSLHFVVALLLCSCCRSHSAVSAGSKLFVRFDIWEQGNVSSLQLSDKLQGALRHALCDVLMELKVLPNPLCAGGTRLATRPPPEEAKGEFMSPMWGQRILPHTPQKPSKGRSSVTSSCAAALQLFCAQN